MRPRDPFTVAVLLTVYVLPLTAAVALLVVVDLPELALALLGVEAAVAGAVVLAARTPDRRRRTDQPPP